MTASGTCGCAAGFLLISENVACLAPLYHDESVAESQHIHSSDWRLSRNAAQAQQSGEGGSDSDFERRLTALAEQTPAQRKADAERVQQDILALEPQFGRVPQAQQRAQQQARPVADDAEAAKPSWLVRVREGGINEKPGPSWLLQCTANSNGTHGFLCTSISMLANTRSGCTSPHHCN